MRTSSPYGGAGAASRLPVMPSRTGRSTHQPFNLTCLFSELQDVFAVQKADWLESAAAMPFEMS